MNKQGLEEMLRRTAISCGCDLWGYEVGHASGSKLLKVYIDREEGVGIDHCVQVTHQLRRQLQVEGGPYAEVQLEISSPGIERLLFSLEQCAQFVNHAIKVSLQEPINARSQWVGRLMKVEGQTLYLAVEGEEEQAIPYAQVRKAKLFGVLQ